MIRTEKTVTVKHKICCTYCGGDIVRHDDAAIQNEFDTIFGSSPKDAHFLGAKACRTLRHNMIPTCKKCGKKFKITFDTNNMEITLENYK